MALSWRQIEDSHIVSACGRFSINRSGRVGFMKNNGRYFSGFLAWVVSRSGDVGTDPWGVIGCFPTIEQAEKACNQHARVVFRDRA